jgi:molybdopterin molybdotransferase
LRVISYDDAFKRLLADLSPVETETVALRAARGRVLAAPVVARRTQPPTATSAMDGFAVRAEDLGGSPTTLRLAGESAAGHPSAAPVRPGEAARISTGAAIPPGATQVVVSEEASIEGQNVVLDARPLPGAHIRQPGVDFLVGRRLLEEGRRLDPMACALAASANALWLAVRRRPRVALLSTGDELVEPGEPASDHQIVNSNAVGLSGLIAEAGGEPCYLGIARDDPNAVRAAYAEAHGADLLVTIGGASIGEHDHVRAVFAEEGGRLAFEKLALKPGKPTWFGRLGDVPVLGLPGNPVSALVVAHLLLAPAVRRLAGEAGAERLDWRRSALAGDLPPTGPRETFLRGVYTDGGRVRVLSNQDSAALSVLVTADVLIRRRADAPAARAGDETDVLPLHRR